MKRQNMINGLATEPTLSNIFKRVGNTISDGSELNSRPIGIVGKNYNFLRNTLQRNIGTSVFNYDGYGTPISMLAETELTSEATPWFLMDREKNRYDNYINYINDTYYRGFMTAPNFLTQEAKIGIFDRNDWLLVNNQVGAVRGYNVYWTPSKDIQGQEHTPTNPNGLIDTQLGKVNNFYLNATMKNAMLHKHQHDNEITRWAYGLFGFDGLKGITDWNMFNGSNQSISNDILTDELIAWTPMTYDHGVGSTQISSNHGYGSYDKITSSQALIDASSDKVQGYIAKSMYGYDLLSDIDITFDDGIDYDHTLNTRKKYYASLNGNKDYLSQITDGVGYYYNADSANEIISYKLMGVGNGLSDSRTIYTYAEAEYSRGSSPYNLGNSSGRNDGVNYGVYNPYHLAINGTDKKDLISYTNQKFINGKYDTLIGRFHTNRLQDDDFLATAISHQYGMSHGRNLLKKDHRDSNTNGYSDPYCRVWTFHKQYHRLVDTIRPFYNENGGREDLQNSELITIQPGRSKLNKHGVKFDGNGLVRCAPTTSEDIKRCMFSIENLAWKHEINMMSGYEKGQKGPLGGRIMWFPPYDLSFSESVNVGWNPTNFIGRGESIYTYTNTERSGQLKFKLLIDHPSILNTWRNGTVGEVDDVESTEQRILRFFAGCEMLGPAPIEEKKEEPKPLPPLPEIELEPIDIPQTKPLQVNFYVFFPNNYSGVNDKADGIVKPVEYLLNGIGAQKYVAGNLSEGLNADNTVASDFPTTFMQGGFGYEVENAPKQGISNSAYGNIGGEKNNKLVPMNADYGGYNHAPIRHLSKNGKQMNYWGYRVDKEYENQVLLTGNYQDTTSYGLNSEKGYMKLLDFHTDANELFDDGTLYSFATVAMGIDSDCRSFWGFASGGYTNEDEATAIATLIDTYKPVSVEVHGFASKHGNKVWNQKLSDNRAHTIMDWLHKCNPSKFSQDLLKCGQVAEGPAISTKNVSDLEAKAWRCSKVTIDFIVDDLSENGEPSKSNETVNDKVAQSAQENAIKESEAKSQQASQELNKSVKDTVVKGYNDEYKFFSELEANKPFLHNKIVDKIKYFDPAFHSITPEGFNSRLTFLHQCTRQGNTSSSSDIHSSSRNASNLAFGAPPICVLRIGDFYNTKIIIESLGIEYDDSTWDLNDEGIGVMPMMATINIGFKFLGGSDLSGPIARLQNAVSFNYYANTSVYDQRAEGIVYDDKGNIKDIETKQ